MNDLKGLMNFSDLSKRVKIADIMNAKPVENVVNYPSLEHQFVPAGDGMYYKEKFLRDDDYLRMQGKFIRNFTDHGQRIQKQVLQSRQRWSGLPCFQRRKDVFWRNNHSSSDVLERQT